MLQEIKDKLNVATYGTTVAEAHVKRVCISCKLMAWKRIKSDKEMDEYKISGLCGTCWRDIHGNTGQKTE